MVRDNLFEKIKAKVEEARKKVMEPTEKHNIGGLDGLKEMMRRKADAK